MSKVLPWIKLGVSVGLLGLVAYLLDWQRSLSLLRGTARSELALGLALLLGAYLVNGIRLNQIQKRVALEVPMSLFWGSNYTGLLFNCVLPSCVGGDAVRVLFLAKRGYRTGALVVSGLVDRFLGLLSLFGLGGIAILAVPSILPIRPSMRLWMFFDIYHISKRLVRTVLNAQQGDGREITNKSVQPPRNLPLMKICGKVFQPTVSGHNSQHGMKARLV